MVRKGDKSRGKRPNQQRRYNKHTGRWEQFTGKPKPVEKKPNDKKDEKTFDDLGLEREHARRTYPSIGYTPSKQGARRKTVPCTCEGDVLESTNRRMLSELRRNKLRGYNVATGMNDVLVINDGFRGEFRRHMNHFRQFLRNERILFVEV
jgi:DNA-directed RNA polymerase subunit N (RpoN/RPB10)